MKKLFTVALISILCGNIQAQQLIDITQRAPDYHYSDTNWIDHYILHYGGDTVFWYTSLEGADFGRPEVARYCYTDTCISVIGVAAVLFFFEVGEGPMINLEQNYFRLYEVQHGTGEMLFLNQAPFVYDPHEEITTRYKMNLYHNPTAPWDKNWYPVIEAYFDKPQIVQDSFYVSVTCFNNHKLVDYRTSSTVKINVKCAYASGWPHRWPDYIKPFYGPKPPKFKIKINDLTDYNYFPYWDITDNNWHVIDTIAGMDYPFHLVMFPIIDTSYRAPRNLCSAPELLTVDRSSGGEAVFSWQDNGAESWELSVKTDVGFFAEEILLHCDSTVAVVTGLDSTKRYKATVRSICSSGDTSVWGKPVTFQTSGTGGTEGVETVVDRYTYVVPNPASDRVMVASSFRIMQVEVFTMGGQRLEVVPVDGLSLNMDISAYAKGSYLLRIHTNNGIATKKLVVK